MAYLGQIQTYYNPDYPEAERWAAESWAGIQEYMQARETPESYAAYWQPTMDMMIGAVASDPEYAARVLDPASEGYNSVVAWIAAHPGSTLEDYFRSEVGQTLIASIPVEPSPLTIQEAEGIAAPLTEVPVAIGPVPLEAIATDDETPTLPRIVDFQTLYPVSAPQPETPRWLWLALGGAALYLLGRR